ncbi:MAG: class I SAM-dependent methyltransferase [Bacteriovoracia bacterium]
MRSIRLSPYRAELLKQVKGNILEIGFGTGANLVYYPSFVKNITTIEPNDAMKVHRKESTPQVNCVVGFAENLPFEGETFDTVVSTFTLCSVGNVSTVLKEINRVLRPSGEFIFLEHGLAQGYRVSKWQNRLNTLSKTLADGCNLNRDFEKELNNSKLLTTRLEKFFAKGYPITHGYFYSGVARKAS